MRRPNDLLCAREALGIDLVLGGHDHDYSLDEVAQPDGTCIHVVKSGALAASMNVSCIFSLVNRTIPLTACSIVSSKQMRCIEVKLDD